MKQSKPLLYVLALVLLGMVLFAYWDHFHNPFHFDDQHTIVSNFYIRDLKNFKEFFTNGATFSSLPANQAYRPGTTLLNAIDCAIGGKGEPIPFYYHISIFISYLVLGIFIYLLSIKIYNKVFKDELNPYIALLTTGVFLLHTANAETINYIISRTDSFSTLMVVISLCIFAYYPKLRKYQLYLVAMAIGFLVKEPAVIVAPLAFLYVYLFEENMGLNQVFTGWKKSLNILLTLLPAFILIVVLVIFSQKMTPQARTLGSSDHYHYLLTETFVMVHYVNNYFFPFNLSADTDWNLIMTPFDDRVVIGVAFIIGTLYLAYRASLQPKWRPVTYGILWFYLALLPTSSVLPFSEVLNDHRVFFPYIGLTMACVWALFMWYKQYESTIFKSAFAKGLIGVFIAAFLVAHMFGVRERVKVWSSETSLWYDVTIKSPHNGRGLMNYGDALMAQGNYNGALEYFNKAKREWPMYSYIYVNMGVLDNAMGKYAEAEQSFKQALSLNPDNPECYYYFANMLKGQGRIAEAIGMAKSGLALSPQHVDLTRIYNEMTNNPAYANQVKDQLQKTEGLAKTNPTPENYLNLSLVYYRNAKYAECAQAAEKALELRPNYDLAYNNICSAYNMLHDWDKAIAAGEKAVQLNPNSELAKNNLKVAKEGKAKGK